MSLYQELINYYNNHRAEIIFGIFIAVISGIIIYFAIGVISFKPTSATIGIIGYNETILPENYRIVVQNEGNNTSQGLGFSVYLLNNNSQISSIQTGEGYLSATYTLVNRNTSAYIIVHSLSPGVWGTINFNLTKPSPIVIKVDTPNSGACTGVIYGFNGSPTNTNSFEEIQKGSSYNGTCGADILSSLVYNLKIVHTEHVKIPINCTQFKLEEIFTNENRLSFFLTTNTRQPLNYSIFKNNEHLYNISTANNIPINISGNSKPYLVRIYTAGNQNYTCSEILIFVNSST